MTTTATATTAIAPTSIGVFIPADHRDLFTRPIVGVLTTLLPEGHPHSSLVWLDLDFQGRPRVNTTLGRQHAANLLRDPRASLLVVDPEDTTRFVQVRGDVQLVLDGAIDHLDELTRKYTGQPEFYGHVYPLRQRERETRVVCRLTPRRVTLDAIHR